MKGSQRHSSLLTEPATFQCSFSFLENKINKKNFWLQLSHMAQNGTGETLLQNPGLCSLCVGSRFYCHYFLFLFHTSLKSFGPSPKSVHLKKNNEEGKQ